MVDFYTNFGTENSKFSLMNISDYLKNHDKIKEKGKVKIRIDPGVEELSKQMEFTYINELHDLIENNKLKDNEEISIDYPCDMIPVPNNNYNDPEYLKKVYEFINKSKANNIRYKDNPKYICTVQFEFMNFTSFKREFDWLAKRIDLSKKVVGIGNMCRIFRFGNGVGKSSQRKYEFCDQVFEYLKEMIIMHDINELHFYGVGQEFFRIFNSKTGEVLRTYIPDLAGYCHISVDNTKWTRANEELKQKYERRVCCRKHNRSEFFETYINDISRFVDVDY
jgi:hypothetical protein